MIQFYAEIQKNQFNLIHKTMKKIETLVSQFDLETEKEIKLVREKFSGNGVKLKMFQEKLDDIENQKKGSIEGTKKILDFLKAKGMTDLRVKGKSYTHAQVVIDSFAIKLSALRFVLESFVIDLVQM